MFLPYIHGCSGYFMVLMFILQGPLDDPVDLFTIKTKLRGGGGGGGGIRFAKETPLKFIWIHINFTKEYLLILIWVHFPKNSLYFFYREILCKIFPDFQT